MRFHQFIAPLVLIPCCAFSQIQNDDNKGQIFFKAPENKNTQVKSYANDSKHLKEGETFTRSLDYPTQIIRISGSLETSVMDCDRVFAEVEDRLISHITPDKYSYMTYISCTYDPETNFATGFAISSFFDPMTDTAVEELNKFLDEYNGSDLLGTKLTIESARAVIAALNISAGFKKNVDKPPFIEYRQDRSNFYFKSNYEMKKTFISDIYQNFFSNDPEKVLPFLDRWIFPNAGSYYKAILWDSNYVQLQPERIFLMDSGQNIFVSNLKFYFSHNCNNYSNHRCLRYGDSFKLNSAVETTTNRS
ncbi:Lpg0189 family type II secretion system effector [Legionella waltersii]|uniref:Uncharacterized protein n=1 Tax=Legionella waltersii TaxID=66969 RepID=A0A0W1ANG5_9GAMM|nr:Lpg0189 family type II secretion system effector [Legionella waltersii]KTD82858.1 hypothetical protein Lwal_0336 [Legionella waltersii]SNV01864.1 Uncharacterised protein [Legionella waltersii]